MGVITGVKGVVAINLQPVANSAATLSSPYI
jgi:hypothetical protein